LEFLPDEEELAKRHAAGQGLTRPEIAVLLCYAKHTLSQQLLASDFPEDPCMGAELERYFPTPIRQGFGPHIHSHRLRREILAGSVANRLINRLGSTFVFRLQDELGASAAALARAYAVVWEVFALRRLWSGAVTMQARMDERQRIVLLLRGVRLARRACRWLLQHHPSEISVAGLIERYRDHIGVLTEQLPKLQDAQSRAETQKAVEDLKQAGLTPDLALRFAGLDALYNGLYLVEVAEQTGMPVEDAARVYFLLGAELNLGWLAQRLAELPSQDRWHASARAALRDELAVRHRDLCIAVLVGGMASASAAAKLETWLRQNNTLVARYRQLIDELIALDEIDLAMLSVALREVQKLAVSSPQEPHASENAK
jgi:glutamate dehydrogenase